MADELLDDAEHAAHLDAGTRGPAHKAAAGAGHQAKGNGKPDRKTGLLVALSAVGVVIAYLTYRSMRGRGASAAAAGGSSATNPANYPGAGTVAGTDPTAGAGFDTMLANLSTQIGALQTSVSAIPTTPSSTSSGTTAAASPHRFQYRKGLHYIRGNGGTGPIYQVESDGAAVYVNAQQWAEVVGLDPAAAKGITNYGSKPKAKPKAAPRHAPGTPPGGKRVKP